MDFEIQTRETVFRGRAFDVQQLTARLPDGRVRTFDLVEHLPSVTVLPLTEEGQILFVRQYRMGAGAALLELPAGVLDAGEDSLTGARRELREETGMDAAEWKLLGGAYLAPGYSSERMDFFLARGLFAAPLKQDDDEFLQLEAIDVADALRMARAGALADAKTLAAFFFALPELGGSA